MLVFILVFISIPAISFFILQNPVIQTSVTKYVSRELAANLGAKINIEKVTVTFLNRFQLKNLYIEDQKGDSLLYAEKITASIRGLNRNTRQIQIKRLNIQDAFINFNIDSSGVINLKFIIDFLKNPDKDRSGEPWKIIVSDIKFGNSRFCLSNEIRKNVPVGINFTNMDLGNLNIEINDFTVKGDSVSMQIKELNMVEKSGFIVNSFTSELTITKNQMLFDNVSILTPFSDIKCNITHFNFLDYKDFSDFIELVNVDMIIEPSQVSFRDISFFSPVLTGYSEMFNVSGHLSGKVNDIRGNQVVLKNNTHTSLKTNFNIIGLPDFKNTFMHFDIAHLVTNTKNIELLKLPGKRKHIKLPANLMKLGKIEYSGKYTGYPDDFVAYGRFRTNLGDLHSDLLLEPDTANTVKYTGRLKTVDFGIGEFLDAKDKIGKISMSGNLEGFISSGRLHAQIESTIDSFEVLNYNYKNILVSGTLTERNFNGSFAVADPNIKLEFSGKADFSGENPEFAFTADVVRARPYYLNIERSDPSFFASFLLKTNFTGKKLDDLNGEISLINSLFSSSDQQIQMYDFSLKASNKHDTSDSVIIRSDLMDGEISGSYKFSTLLNSFRKVLYHYIPAYSSVNQGSSPEEDENHFQYDFRFKNIHPFIVFFFHNFDIGNNTILHGHYNPSENDLYIKGECPLFSYKGNVLENISISSSGFNKEYNVNLSGAKLKIDNNLEIENLLVNAMVFSDTANIRVLWNNNDTLKYDGNIDFVTVFKKNSISGNTRLNIEANPSYFHYNNILWNIPECKMAIDPRYFMIDTLRIRNQEQDFLVYGTVSENPADILNVKFSNLDVSTLNVFTRKAKMEMGGLLSGEASISDPMNKPLFTSDLIINDFVVNNEKLGQGMIHGFWNNLDKKIELKVETMQSETNNKQLQIVGDFYPENDKIDFDILVNQLNVTMFEPFLSELISDLKGLGSGNLTLTGTTKKPDLNGQARLQKTSLLVNYLFTRYYFTNDLKILHNNIIFKDFEIFDEKGNKAVSQGTIFTNDLKGINLDLKLNANNFTFLNTTEKDNDLFYGKINASGMIRFTGPADNLMMDINAKTERNSVFFLPLYGAEEIYENDFIQWVSGRNTIKNEDEEEESSYEVKLKGLKMNFNLEVTPDAEVQLIFDPKVGDILRGRGNGNLKLLINTLGKFEIFGDIIIERGDYLFTLKNLINKYFQVERGGRISWNGDPLDANIDLRAVYKLKTSIYALAPEPSESLKKKMPVETHIIMTGKLMSPTITPDILLPTADQQTKNILKNRITTEEEMMKQFISLLVINNFYSDMNASGFGGAATRSSGVAASELFSNQLSRWFSQISKDFDVGFNYRMGDEITTDQLEVALSTQILNDRISISGNFGVGGGQQTAVSQTMTNPNNIVGDFDIDFRLTESGKIHLKAFNRTNDNLLFTSPYTQGVGITYRENFNSFGELMHRYYDALLSIFSKKKRQQGDAEINKDEEDEIKEDL